MVIIFCNWLNIITYRVYCSLRSPSLHSEITQYTLITEFLVPLSPRLQYRFLVLVMDASTERLLSYFPMEESNYTKEIQI